MTTSLATLQELSKQELIEKVQGHAKRALAAYQQHRGTIRRVGMLAAQNTAAVAAGVLCGGLEIKMRTIPKTRVRTDLVLASGIALANLANVFGDATPIFQSSADAFTGHGVGRGTEKFLLSKGVRPGL